MAFKKKEEAAKQPAEKKEARTYSTKWSTIEEVLKSKQTKDALEIYTLAPEVELTINSDKMWAQVNYMGCSFFTTIKEKKDGGYFLSFPSYKKKNGDWEDVVTIYDKGFHAIVKELLAKIAEE